jgi:hypothetical protein
MTCKPGLLVPDLITQLITLVILNGTILSLRASHHRATSMMGIEDDTKEERVCLRMVYDSIYVNAVCQSCQSDSTTGKLTISKQIAGGGTRISQVEILLRCFFAVSIRTPAYISITFPLPDRWKHTIGLRADVSCTSWRGLFASPQCPEASGNPCELARISDRITHPLSILS